MHAGQQLPGIVAECARGALAAPVVDVAEFADAVVAHPAVGGHGGARFDVITQERP